MNYRYKIYSLNVKIMQTLNKKKSNVHWFQGKKTVKTNSKSNENYSKYEWMLDGEGLYQITERWRKDWLM